MKINKKWDLRFLNLAKTISTWSKDPSTKVGSIVVDENKIILGLGYNGFPRNIEDNLSDYENRDTKIKMIVHAEVNAILNCSTNLTNINSILYVYPLLPCNECCKFILQSGIKRVVSVKVDDVNFKKRWDLNFSQHFLQKGGVEITLYNNNDLLHEN